MGAVVFALQVIGRCQTDPGQIFVHRPGMFIGQKYFKSSDRFSPFASFKMGFSQIKPD